MMTMIITITIDEEFWVSLIWEAWETQEAYETQETKETHCHEAQQIAGHNPHLHPDHDVETSGHQNQDIPKLAVTVSLFSSVIVIQPNIILLI